MSLFQKASEREESNALVGLVWGLAKTGKTTFCIGNEAAGLAPWPTPIFYFNYDNSIDPLLRMASKETRDNLYVVDLVDTDVNLTLDKARRQLQLAEDALREATAAIRAAGRGTIAVDTMSHHWQLVQAVEYEPLAKAREEAGKKKIQTEYGMANARHRNFVNALRASGGNVLFMAHSKPVYIGPDRTEMVEPAAQKELDNLVDFRVRTYAAEVRDGKGKRVGTENGGDIEYCRNNNSVAGNKLPNLDYPMLYSLIFEREPGE